MRPGALISLWIACSLPLSLAVGACGVSAEVSMRAVGELDFGGRVERIEALGRYSSSEAAFLFQLAGNRAEVSTDNDFYLYRVVYPTAAVHGGVTRVSGLVALPTTSKLKGVVSWQHGTNSYRPNSISRPSIPEGLAVAALFASAGFVTVAPDYIGLGVSTEPHPYYHWPSTVSTVIDLLSIAEIVLDGIGVDPDRDLYLAGFSQGAGATAAVQRSLEADNRTGLRLRAAAAVAGAFNPREISLAHFIESDEPFFLAMVLAAFSAVYGESLEGIVQAPYAGRLADWFDGTHDQTFITQQLPSHLDEFLSERFLADHASGTENPRWFYEALELAATHDYAPSAPLRSYFGSEDDTVVPEEALAAFAHMQALGGNVELVEVGPYTHDDMVLHSLPSIQQWFEQLDRSHH